jgi:hypothetical protein
MRMQTIERKKGLDVHDVREKDEATAKAEGALAQGELERDGYQECRGRVLHICRGALRRCNEDLLPRESRFNKTTCRCRHRHRGDVHITTLNIPAHGTEYPATSRQDECLSSTGQQRTRARSAAGRNSLGRGREERVRSQLQQGGGAADGRSWRRGMRRQEQTAHLNTAPASSPRTLVLSCFRAV